MDRTLADHRWTPSGPLVNGRGPLGSNGPMDQWSNGPGGGGTVGSAPRPLGKEKTARVPRVMRSYLGKSGGQLLEPFPQKWRHCPPRFYAWCFSLPVGYLDAREPNLVGNLCPISPVIGHNGVLIGHRPGLVGNRPGHPDSGPRFK